MRKKWGHQMRSLDLGPNDLGKSQPCIRELVVEVLAENIWARSDSEWCKWWTFQNHTSGSCMRLRSSSILPFRGCRRDKRWWIAATYQIIINMGNLEMSIFVCQTRECWRQRERTCCFILVQVISVASQVWSQVHQYLIWILPCLIIGLFLQFLFLWRCWVYCRISSFMTIMETPVCDLKYSWRLGSSSDLCTCCCPTILHVWYVHLW